MQCAFILFFIGHIVVHLVAFVAIFDIYFTSPVVQNIRPLEISVKSPADRLVLFVADGLRADKFFELDRNRETRAPFLRGLMKTNAVWGVSHTQAPTESRPAHVAILGGFYEDMSAVKLYWKDNPIEFDTALNQSRETWAWGAPDVLPFFNKGSAESHVHIDCHQYLEYPLSRLDVWVFNQVKAFFERAKRQPELHTRLLQNKIIFFLHLAGVDSNGHRYGSSSHLYIDNIPVVDKVVKDTVKLFQQFYDDDKKTAFIFTADHGQTDNEGHGGSHPNETQVPIVAWGAGIRDPSKESEHYGRIPMLGADEKRKTREWSLDDDHRVDVSQIDISVLMTSLLGIPFPVNSQGMLPLPYISTDIKAMAKLAHAHARQVSEQVITKMKHIKENIFHFVFWHFRGIGELEVMEKNMKIDNMIQNTEYQEALDKASGLSKFFLQAVHYYQVYHRSFIHFSLSVSLVGSMLLVGLLITNDVNSIQLKTKDARRWNALLSVPTTLLSIVCLLMLYYYKSSWSYYAYCFLPLLIWYVVLSNQHRLQTVYHQFRLDKTLLVAVTATFAFTWLFMLGFQNKQYLSIGMFLLSLMPYCTLESRISRQSFTWSVLCLICTLFPLLPEMSGRNAEVREGLVFLAGLCASLLCFCIKIHHGKGEDMGEPRSVPYVVGYARLLLPALCGLMVYKPISTVKLAGNFILVLSGILPVFHEPRIHKRLLSFYIWNLSAYVLLSQSYDALFAVVLCALLYSWIDLEHTICNHAELQETSLQDIKLRVRDRFRSRDITLHDLRRVLVFITLLLYGFFGISSVESISKFKVRSLPLLPNVDHTMLVMLLIYKLYLHYLLIASSFIWVMAVSRSRMVTYWFLVVIVMDFMLLHFQFWVKETGSWAEIGISIACSVIVTFLPIAIFILLAIAKILTSIRLPTRFRFTRRFGHNE